jgi:hypothetical protein
MINSSCVGGSLLNIRYFQKMLVMYKEMERWKTMSKKMSECLIKNSKSKKVTFTTISRNRKPGSGRS